MTVLSNAEAALLGLLAEEAMHPYQIEREVKFRDMRFWTDLSMSSIYKLLPKLEKDGLVDLSTRVTDKNRLRKQYSVTETGRKALQAKLDQLLREPEHVRWQVDIGIYNADLLPVKKVREALLVYRSELEKKMRGYQDLLKFLKASGCPKHRFGVATRPVFLLKAEMKWVDEYLSSLS